MSIPNIVSSGFSEPAAVKFVAFPTTAAGSFCVIEIVSPSARACAAEHPRAAGTSSARLRSRVRVMRRRLERAAQRTLNASLSTLAGLSSHAEFRILGPLEARVDGAVVALGAPRQRLLLAALLLAAPAPLRREQLIDEVWGAAPPA